MAKSLIEGLDKGPAPAKNAPSKNKSNSGKLVLALVLLAIAGGVFAWSQGWIMAGSGKDVVTAEEKVQQQKEFVEQKKAVEQQIKQGAAKPAGSS